MKQAHCKACKVESNEAQTRRDFLAHMAKAATVMTLAPYLSFGAQPLQRRAMVVVFLRGGADGLSLLPPAANGALNASYNIYRDARQGLGLTPQQAQALGNSGFALHPELEPLRDLYNQGKLLFAHGVGSPNTTRSHFEQQDLMEFGDPMRTAQVRTGYLRRALDELQAGLAPSESLPGVSLDTKIAKSLRGGDSVAVPANLAQIGSLAAPQTQTQLSLRERLMGAWRSLPQEPNWIDRLSNSSGKIAVDALDQVQRAVQSANNLTLGTTQSYGSLNELRSTAILLASDPGLRFVTVNAGGWDTHFSMGVLDGAFSNNVAGVAKGLRQFATDLQANNLWNSTTVVVMSEFGRRVAANGSGGVDHGRGGVMMVMGGGVAGGKVISHIPGGDRWDLARLEEPGDVRITVDYRYVLSEILARKFQLPVAKISEVIFPGFTPRAIGVL